MDSYDGAYNIPPAPHSGIDVDGRTSLQVVTSYSRRNRQVGRVHVIGRSENFPSRDRLRPTAVSRFSKIILTGSLTMVRLINTGRFLAQVAILDSKYSTIMVMSRA